MILVIDCGLSAVKLSVADTDGQLIASIRVPYPTARRGEACEQEPADWWDAIHRAVMQLPQRKQITVIVPTGHMHGLVLVDEALRPLLPCLTLLDRRGAEHLGRLAPEAFQLATGEILDASLPLAKLLWLAEKQPELVEGAAALLAPKDFIQARLTGRVATDPVDAAGTGLFHLQSGTWSSSILTEADLPDHFLPPVLASTELAPIRRDVAGLLGLPATALVAVGAGDDIELLGATAHRPESAVEHVGTTGAIMRALPGGAPSTPGPQMEIYPTAMPGRLAAGVSTAHAGSVFEWLQRSLGVEPEQIFERDPDGGEPVVTHGLFAERGNGDGPAAGAVIRGLTADHDRFDLSRALIIDVTVRMRKLLSELEDRTGPVDTIYASGGAGGQAWARWRAAAYDRPLSVLHDDPTARGCVAIGLAASAGRSDIEALAAELPGELTLVEPSSTLASIFEQLAPVSGERVSAR